MIRAIAMAGALALAGVSSAVACPEPSETLLFHSCWGDARASVLLLPEDEVPGAKGEGRRLVVTGAYTAREPREGNKPKPVGWFMRDGVLVNQNMARMDGLMIVDSKGGVRLVDRSAAPLDGESFNLREVEPRAAFRQRASDLRLDILQSHLLIIDGEPDVAEQSDAPEYRRRLLFTAPHGWGLWESRGAVTLHDAAYALKVELKPDMALNLDMGSYDYCQRIEDGETRNCGVLPAGQTEKLSNLILLELR